MALVEVVRAETLLDEGFENDWLRELAPAWKPNPKPEGGVTNRPTKSHEQLFLFSKNPRYHYDIDALREPVQRGECGLVELFERG